MSYIDSNLAPGETTIYKTRLHWIGMLRYIVWGVLAAIIGAFVLYYALTQPGLEPDFKDVLEAAGSVLLLACIIALFMGAAQRNATEMAVTNLRVVIKVGLVGRRTVEMVLNKVETIEVRETGMGRTLGYGTVIVIGTGGTPEPFAHVAHPLQFRSAVQQQIEKLH